MPWFGVRIVVRIESDSNSHLYEERVTIWQATDFDDATARASAEAADYAADVEGIDLGLAQAFLIDGEPGDGAEVFSLMRRSSMSPSDYVTSFFDTGRERQQTD